MKTTDRTGSIAKKTSLALFEESDAMTTTTQLRKYRRQHSFEAPISVSTNVRFRELWADGLTAVATNGRANVRSQCITARPMRAFCG